ADQHRHDESDHADDERSEHRPVRSGTNARGRVLMFIITGWRRVIAATPTGPKTGVRPAMVMAWGGMPQPPPARPRPLGRPRARRGATPQRPPAPCRATPSAEARRRAAPPPAAHR